MGVDSYLDTSFLLKLYLLEPHSDAAIAWLHSYRGKVFVSPLTHIEAVMSLTRDPSTAAGLKNVAAYREDIQAGIYQVVAIDADVFAFAESLAAFYSRAYKLRSLDMLHLATALHYNVGIFGTYDDRLARAATAAGLQVIAPRS